MGWMHSCVIVLAGLLSVHSIYIKCPDLTVFDEDLNRCYLPDSELFKCPQLLRNDSSRDNPYAFDCQRFVTAEDVNEAGHSNDQSYAKYRLHLQHSHLQYNVKANMGQLIVEFNNENTTMNTLNFGHTEANVACRELGFRLGADDAEPLLIDPTHQTPSSMMFYMDGLSCRGNETALAQCSHNGWNKSEGGSTIYLKCKEATNICQYNEWPCPNEDLCLQVPLICDQTPHCQDNSDESIGVCNKTVEFRLVNTEVPAGERVKNGRVEMLYNGLWGSVSSYGTSTHEASVVCRSLGISDRGIVNAEASQAVKTHVWLHDVDCYKIADTKNLMDCNKNIMKENDIFDSEFALWVSCVGNYTAPVIKETPTITRHNHHESTNTCGQIQVSSNEIVPPSFARHGQWPWMAKIYVYDIQQIMQSKCGGSVLDKRHILTAAHCINAYSHQYYRVRVGKHNYETTPENGESPLDLSPEMKFTHQQFSERTLQNDIAVLRLTRDIIDFGDYVQPICLPTRETQYHSRLSCTIAGWGWVHSKNNATTDDLRATSVPIMNDEVCESVYNEAERENKFCAGYMDDVADACKHDSGGPLVCMDDAGVHTLYGIVSSGGEFCGQLGKPGVYVKVSKYIDWINDTIHN